MGITGRQINVTLSALCDGCDKCVEACEQVSREREHSEQGVGIKLIKSDAGCLPVLCRNCEDAPCVTACMTGCRQKNEYGLVVTDDSRCVGCRMCVMNCPFGAIEMTADERIATKCDGCLNEDTAPCVAACRMGVLTHMPIVDLTSRIRERAATRFFTGFAEEVEG